MKGLIKRITSLLCALIIATIALLSCPLRVKATSIPAPVGSEATIEAMMTLWNLLVNGMIASGAGEAVASYDSEKSLMDAFMDFCSSMVATNSEYAESFVARTTGGQYVSLDDMISAYDKGTITMPDWWVDEWDVDEETGEDVITLPNDDIWGKYRVGTEDDFDALCEAWKKRNEELGSGSGGSEPEEPKDPEFSKLETFSINAGFLTLISDFFASVFNGEVDEVNNVDIYGYNLSTYTEPIDHIDFYIENSTYLLSNGFMSLSISTVDEDLPSPKYLCFIKSKTYNAPMYGYTLYQYTGALSKYEYYGLNGKYISYTGYSKNYSDLKLTNTNVRNNVNTFDVVLEEYSNTAGTEVYSSTIYKTNIPVFNSTSDARNYFETGDTTGLLNANKYDYPELITSMRSIMEPLSGVQLSPSTLQKTYTGMKTSYEEDIKPQISSDAAVNTQTYTETMTQTVTDTVTSVAPSPAPSPDIPGTDTGTETEAEIEDYKVDLRMVFPFCLPFDFIALLQALDAEPETPRFEIPFVVPALDLEMTVDIDLSFLDDVMENLRRIELVGFIVFLIFATGKLIKW